MDEKEGIEVQKRLGLSNSSISRKIMEAKATKVLTPLKPFNYFQEKPSKFQRSLSSEARSRFTSSNSKGNSTNSNSMLKKYNTSIKKISVSPLSQSTASLNKAQNVLNTVSSRRDHPLFKINLEIAEGMSELVTFYPHNHIEAVAYEISLKHNLKNEKYIILKKILQDNYDRCLNESRKKLKDINAA